MHSQIPRSSNRFQHTFGETTMRRPIIYLVVALLTFALGTISSLLFHGILTPFSEKVTRQSVAPRIESPATAPAIASETISEQCGCAGVGAGTVSSATDQAKAPISGGILNGKAISLPRPTYPSIARAARASGTVTVQVVIDERGCIQTARAVSGHPLLQAAAVKAARQACFSPTRLQGQPVKVSGVITYNFVLQ
jgi:TonB family protein